MPFWDLAFLQSYLEEVLAEVLTRGDAVTEPEVVCLRMHTIAKMTSMRPELKMGTRIITANGMASSFSTPLEASLANSGISIVGLTSPIKKNDDTVSWYTRVSKTKNRCFRTNSFYNCILDFYTYLGKKYHDSKKNKERYFFLCKSTKLAYYTFFGYKQLWCPVSSFSFQLQTKLCGSLAMLSKCNLVLNYPLLVPFWQ